MKYIIKWDAGYGDTYEEIEADSEEEAADYAYECWHEEVESNGVHGCVGESTDELRDELGL